MNRSFQMRFLNCELLECCSHTTSTTVDITNEQHHFALTFDNDNNSVESVLTSAQHAHKLSSKHS